MRNQIKSDSPLLKNVNLKKKKNWFVIFAVKMFALYQNTNILFNNHAIQ